jgi:hypothetical protein
MKKAILSITGAVIFGLSIYAQEASTQQLQATVSKLDKATTVKEYKQLAIDFKNIGDVQKTQWLPYYYAAFCNAKIAWLYQEDGDKIEPYADKAEEQIKKSQSLLDTSKQKKELSEVYCVLNMTNQAKVFINPQTYGPQYGPAAAGYLRAALQANANNPRALYIAGWTKFATPKMWGGDKQEAKKLLEQSLNLLSTSTASDINPHWGKKEAEDLLKQLK